MISKVKISSNNFINICKYVCSDQGRADVLSVNGVREEFGKMADDFQGYRDGARKQNVVFHGILSFPKGEMVDDSTLQKIAELYLERLGLGNSPYSIVKHKDKEHCHLHIISSLIDLDGKIVNDSFIGLRAKKIAQALTREFGLIPADTKHLSQTHLKALKGKDLDKYKMYLVVSSILPKCNTFPEFEKKLKEKDIEILYKYKRNSDQIQGISFRNKEGYTIKGSELDRKYSYISLCKHFGMQMKDVQLGFKDTQNETGTKQNNDQQQAIDLPELLRVLGTDYTINLKRKPDEYVNLSSKKKKRRKNLSI